MRDARLAGKTHVKNTQRLGRRWLRFGLRSLIVLMLACCVALSWLAHRLHQARTEKEASAKLFELGAELHYELDPQQKATGPAASPRPAFHRWGRTALGDEFFDRVVRADLSNCNFGAQDLACLQSLSHLQSLDLSSSNVTDQQLAYLQRLEELERLGLAYTEITDAGLKELSQNKSLRVLVLTGSQITDEGLKHLEELPNLEQLHASKTYVTAHGLKELQRAIPRCQLIDGRFSKRLAMPTPAKTRASR